MSDRIVEYHMSRLKDRSVQARLNAIQELLLLEATDALSELEEVFHNDPDESVRKAAQRAGRELFLLKRARQQEDE